MWIIDRYLLRQYIKAFLICWISLTGLYVVFDAFTNLDHFLHYAEKRGGLLAAMCNFYSYRTLFFFDRSSAVLSMIAAMFTVTWIQRHNELTALMAAGVPRLRVVRTVFVAAASISVLAAANRELVIPQISEELSQRPEDLVGTSASILQPRYDHRTNILMRGKATYANQQRIDEPNFVLPSTLDQHGKHLAAENAYYLPADANHPGGYLFSDVLEPRELLGKPCLSLDGENVIFTPAAASWLKPNECFVASEVTFQQLAGGNTWKQYSSTSQLIDGLDNPSLDFGADVRVAIHSRFTQPLLDVTLLFLALPLVLRGETRNIYIAIGMCLALVVVYMVTILACQYLGSVYLIDPALAAWIPLMIFVPAAVGLFDRVER